jgi:hypothetical protein
MSEEIEVSSRRRRSSSEIAELVKAYEQSGLTRRAFCAERGLARATLSVYLQRHRRMKSEQSKLNRIVPVELVKSPVSNLHSDGALYVELAKGRRIVVASGFDTTTLVRLITALEEA